MNQFNHPSPLIAREARHWASSRSQSMAWLATVPPRHSPPTASCPVPPNTTTTKPSLQPPTPQNRHLLHHPLAQPIMDKLVSQIWNLNRSLRYWSLVSSGKNRPTRDFATYRCSTSRRRRSHGCAFSLRASPLLVFSSVLPLPLS